MRAVPAGSLSSHLRVRCYAQAAEEYGVDVGEGRAAVPVSRGAAEVDVGGDGGVAGPAEIARRSSSDPQVTAVIVSVWCGVVCSRFVFVLVLLPLTRDGETNVVFFSLSPSGRFAAGACFLPLFRRRLR